MKKLFLAVLVISMILILALAGCGEPAAENGENGGPGENGENGADNEAVSEQRIISLMPSNTEILFALGLGDAVVGVTDYCNYPPEMEAAAADGRIQRVGDAFSLNEELIVSLEPTLVLLGYDNETLVEQLHGYGIDTAVIFPQSIQGVMESLLMVGELTGRLSEAEALAGEMEAAFAELEAKTAGLTEAEKPRVLMLLDLDFLFVAGTGTLEDELIAMAGGINVVEIAGYDSVSEEMIVESRPEFILSSFPFREQIVEKGTWQELPAVQNGAIFDLDGDLINRPAPRLVEGLRALLNLLHPDL